MLRGKESGLAWKINPKPATALPYIPDNGICFS
jgi:hypothetical protein